MTNSDLLRQSNDLFKKLYNVFSKDNLDKLPELYAEDIVFIDPFHRVEGIVAFEQYFANMYQNVRSITFEFHNATFGDQVYHQDWVMTFCHPKINAGKPVEVPGCTRVRINDAGKIIEHQDYFDGAQMLYKQLPVLGSAINYINRRMAS
jgi:ketosteroid isomerase-like protein